MKRIIATLLIIITLQSMFIAHSIPIVYPHDRWAFMERITKIHTREKNAKLQLAMVELGNEFIPAMPAKEVDLPR